MKRLIALSIALAFGGGIAAQTPAPAAPAMTPEQVAAKKAADRKAKQQMVQGTTEAATAQSTTTPLRGSKPASELTGKPTKEQRMETMQGVNKSAASQYGPAASEASGKIDKTAPKAVKPDMTDPAIQKAMQNQKGG